MIRITKTILMEALIRNEEEATSVCSSGSSLPLTYLMWAFFNRALFVDSKIPVIVRNNAQVPIWSIVNFRVSRTKLINPKNVSENR
jgi:hypothetical protein